MPTPRLPLSVPPPGFGRALELLLSLLLLAAVSPQELPAQVGPQPGELISRLQARVAAQPADAPSWRLLGRAHEAAGELPLAAAALEQAVRLDPASAAAQADFGRVLLGLGQSAAAAEHFQAAIELAPESDYAREAHAALRAVDPGSTPAAIPVSFEVDWLDPPAAEPPVPLAASPWFVRLETGVLYNSNVALAPISRELSPGERASFQGFAAPEVEYRWPVGAPWQVGGLLRGYFNVNEQEFREFDLQHFQPGVFAEGILAWDEWEMVPRVEYNYDYDLFNGQTLGSRHGVTTSLSMAVSPEITWMPYWTSEYTDFRDDGVEPAVASLDGWSQTVGMSRTRAFGWRHLALLRTGAEMQWADLQGSSFRYRGVMLYADAEIPLFFDTLLVLQGGWGYRDYPDFEFTPSRNEHLIRAGVELRKRLTEHWSLVGSHQFDRFASENELFDATRHTSGVWVAFER